MSITNRTLIFFFLAAFASALQLFPPQVQILKTTRSVGDILYENCQNTTVAGQKIDNACVILKEAQDCGVDVVLTISGVQIFDENLDLQLSPQVCGKFTPPGSPMECDLCVSLALNPQNQNQRCVTINPTCATIPFQGISAGCFDNSVLANVVSCASGLCPNDCSGHGSCVNGTCQCDDPWRASDCSVTGDIYEVCQKVDEETGDLCVRMKFDQCKINFAMILESGALELPLYARNYSVAKFMNLFQDGQCATVGSCSACLAWRNMQAEDTYASGCGSLSVNCIAMSESYDLGCFNDTQVLPSCFVCPTGCSGNGECVRGVCKCNGDWAGDDCSVHGGCPNDCSGNGTCQAGRKCQCDPGFAGTDCSIEKNSLSSSSVENPKKSGVPVAAIVIPIVVVLVLVVIGAVIYFKRRSSRPVSARFSQLTSVDIDEEEEGLVDN